jgi:ABC-type sugar transport system substrate-binding protein
MEKVKEFLKKKNIEISVKRYFIDALGAMAQGLFASLLIGTIIGTMSQDPYGMGYAAITTAARSVAGQEKADHIYSAHQWIDSENLQTKEVQSLLNF